MTLLPRCRYCPSVLVLILVKKQKKQTNKRVCWNYNSDTTVPAWHIQYSTFWAVGIKATLRSTHMTKPMQTANEVCPGSDECDLSPKHQLSQAPTLPLVGCSHTWRQEATRQEPAQPSSLPYTHEPTGSFGYLLYPASSINFWRDFLCMWWW